MVTADEVNRLCDWAVSDDFNAQTPDDLSASALVKKGGQGAVFSGTYAGQAAAVKVYYPGQLYKRVEREIDALASLDCPSIVNLYWSGTVEYDGEAIPVTSTEFITGSDLRDCLGNGSVEAYGRPSASGRALIRSPDARTHALATLRLRPDGRPVG
ncbi:MAG: hypothetical protein ABJF88_05880, partial [Rhodothermales bacterium]